jgi:hypothetical protein
LIFFDSGTKPNASFLENRLALVDHRQSADLQLLHVLHGFGEVVVITAAMDAWCHHITRRRAECIEVVLRETFAKRRAVHSTRPPAENTAEKQRVRQQMLARNWHDDAISPELGSFCQKSHFDCRLI